MNYDSDGNPWRYMKVSVIRAEAQSFVCRDMPEPEDADFENAEWVRFRAEVEFEQGDRIIPKGTRVKLKRFGWTDGNHGPKTVPFCEVEAEWGVQLIKKPFHLLEVCE